MAKELMDFELLHGTHSTGGSVIKGSRPDSPDPVRYVKVPNGPRVFLKDHRDLVALFPYKFSRIYPEQMRQILTSIEEPADAPVVVPSEGEEGDERAVKAGLKEMPDGATDVTDTFPSAGKNDLIVLRLKDHTYSVYDKDDAMERASAMKTLPQVRKWLKENVEDEGGGE